MRRWWEPKVADITAHYHRNGIGGRSFTAITFTSNDPSESYYNGILTAIIPEKDGYELHDVECFVIHTSKPDLCYRGDNFDAYMREIVEAHDIKVREQLNYACKHPRKEGEQFIDPGITHFKDMDEVRAFMKAHPNSKED